MALAVTPNLSVSDKPQVKELAFVSVKVNVFGLGSASTVIVPLRGSRGVGQASLVVTKDGMLRTINVHLVLSILAEI